MLEPRENPVLDSVQPVIEGSRDVRTDLGRLADVASWLAYEELPKPAQMLPVRLDGSREEIADFVLVAASLNVAYTDFETRQRWDLVVDGRAYADADGLHVALHRALGEGVPVLDGSWLQSVTADDLRQLLRDGTSELQMLDERAAILREVGETNVAKYDGSFSNVLRKTSTVRSCAASRSRRDQRGRSSSVRIRFTRPRCCATASTSCARPSCG